MSQERSAEWLRGAVHVAVDCEEPVAVAYYTRLLAAAEAREAGERIGESLLDRLRQDLPAIRYHLGGVGPKIKLALDDSSRQSNILVAIHALDALLPLLTKAREGGERITVNAGEVPDSWVKQRYLATKPTALPDVAMGGTVMAGNTTGAPTAAEVIASAEKALEGALALDPHCDHAYTHRVGAIWTICDDCGKEWADDKGGFKPDKPNKHILKIEEALALIAKWKEAQRLLEGQ